MTTTSTANYGWTIPNDSELVKDGAAAIRTLGNAADASLKTVSDAAINKTLIDAKGDLIVGSAADTAARLAVGTNDYVLTADSTTATGLKWASAAGGGYTLLSTTSISGTSTTVSSISQSYKHLFGIWYGISAPNDGTLFGLNVNGSSGIGYHSGTRLGNSTIWNQSATFIWLTGSANGIKAANTNNSGFFFIYDYTNTNHIKNFSASGMSTDSNSSLAVTNTQGFANTTSAVSSLVFQMDDSASMTAGTLKLYGVS